MEKFNSTEFCTLVKKLKETMGKIVYDSQVKNIFFQALRDKDYDIADVLNYLASIWEKTYPHYTDRFNSQKWSNVFDRYIKYAEDEYDWELARTLKDKLASVTCKGKDREEQLKDRFFNLMDEMGVDVHLLKIDMSLDFFGWMKTLDLIISISESGTMADESVSSEYAVAATMVPEAKPAMEGKKKTRKRTKWIEIQQFSIEGELIHIWKSISEASKTLNLNHASISKCVNGSYKTAGGFKWVGIKEEDIELSKKEAA